MILADALRTSYADREPAARVIERDGTITVEGDGYRLMFTLTTPIVIAVEGTINRDGFYALGLTDEQTGGAISAALDRSGHRCDAEQVRFSLDAIQCGRGPIYAKGQVG